MSPDAEYQKTLEVAERVVAIASGLGVDLVLIGALALATYGYVRATTDLDLASAVDPFSALHELTKRLNAIGLDAELSEPDAQDPLGGVITVRGEGFKPIQIVNFFNPFNGLAPVGQEAVRTATPLPGETLRVVDLPHLIALKLYAGGRKSTTDVIELLERNPEADRAGIREVCERFGLREPLEAILSELEPG